MCRQATNIILPIVGMQDFGFKDVDKLLLKMGNEEKLDMVTTDMLTKMAQSETAADVIREQFDDDALISILAEIYSNYVQNLITFFL